MDLVRLTDSLPLPPWARLVVLNLCVILCYLLLAQFGLSWSALTSQVSLVWPAAGLALFVLMAFGWRAAPAVLLGSACASLLLHFVPEQVVINLDSLGVLLAMAGADLLQVSLIVRLNPGLLTRAGRVRSRRLLFFIACILLCNLFSASVGVLALHHLDLLPVSSLPETWLTWWMGDTIGMLILTPLLAWLLLPGLRHQEARSQSFLLLNVGLGVVLLLVAMLGYLERSAAKERFQAQSDLLWLDLHNRLVGSMADLELVQQSLALQTSERQNFPRLGLRLLEHNPWLNQLAWVPIKPTDLGHQPSLLGLNLDDSQMLEGQSAQQRQAQLGLGHPGNRTALLNAWETDQVRSGPLFYDARNRPSLELYLPVSRCNSRSPCLVQGLLSARLDLTAWAGLVLPGVDGASLHVQLISAGQYPLRLAWNGKAWVETEQNGQLDQARLVAERSLPLANQQLVLVSYYYSHRWLLPSWLQLTTLALGVLLLWLLDAFLRTRHKHQDLLLQTQSRLQEEVYAQTLALRKANDWLLKEVEQRQLTQDQLEASQEVLRQRERELRSLLDHIPDPVWLKDTLGNYLNSNRAFARLLGKSEEEIVGRSDTLLVTGDIAQVFRYNDRVALASHVPHRHEQWLLGADGRLHLLDTLKVAVRDDDGNTYGVLGIGRDVTEKHELISELEKFKRFAEFSGQGFGIASLQGEPLYMNPHLRQMLSAIDQASGAAASERFRPYYWDYYTQVFQQRVRDIIFPQVIDRGDWQGELAARHGDGSEFPTQETFFVIRDDQGKPQYVGNVMNDISAQKLAEAELSRARDAAEEGARAKSRFLANMSHEIRTPLNAVLGYTQLLMRDPQVAGNQRERLQFILNASQRLLGLINDILDLSKIESGAINLRQDLFDVHQEMHELHAIISERAQAKGLGITLNIDFPAPDIVRGDRQKLGQILLNLLGNAVKFTQQGGVNLHLGREGDQLVFVISDSGPGIAPQELEQLFSAFRQGQAGQDSGGTGLGLALSRNLALAMGGDLRLTSQLGKGTQARLQLPLPREQLTRATGPASLGTAHLAEGSRCHVLVVEDDLASADVLVSLLESLGCTTRCAHNGHEGIDWSAREGFDIVFTDIRMPGLNGLEMLRQLRTNPQYLTPLIAVSASSLEHERTYYLAQGFHDFIGKPYDFEEIVTALQQHAQMPFERTAAAVVAAVEPQDGPLDLAHWGELLVQIQQAAASGDMGLCKKLAQPLGPEQIGGQRQQQLAAALKHYDLERLEALIKSWMK